MSVVLARLDAEWEELARAAVARRALRRWQVAHPTLRGVVDLAGLLERRRDPELAQGILAALAALAPGNALAARTLLQALLPGLVRLAVSSAQDDPAALDEMVGLAWERIRTYPATRRGSVAGNVLLDVRKRYWAYRELDAPKRKGRAVTSSAAGAPVVWVRLGPQTDGVPQRSGNRFAASAEEEALERLAARELLAAQRAAVGEQALRALVRTRVEGLSLGELAAEEGVSVGAVTMRRWRATQQLRRLPLAG